MKKIILMLGIVIISLCSFAGTPPLAVQKAFEQKFPNATKVSWDMENKTEWEADFTFNEKKLSANFSVDGLWVETEQKINVSEFPKAVTDAIQKKYPEWKITEADRTESAKNGLIYEADMKSGTQKKEVAFKEDGSAIIE